MQASQVLHFYERGFGHCHVETREGLPQTFDKMVEAELSEISLHDVAFRFPFR